MGKATVDKSWHHYSLKPEWRFSIKSSRNFRYFGLRVVFRCGFTGGIHFFKNVKSRHQVALFVIFSGKNAFFPPSIPTLPPKFFWLFCSFLGITNDEPRGKCN